MKSNILRHRLCHEASDTPTGGSSAIKKKSKKTSKKSLKRLLKENRHAAVLLRLIDINENLQEQIDALEREIVSLKRKNARF